VRDRDGERERQRLRQLAETAGSNAPRNMRRAIERDTPPAQRPWSVTGRAERVAVVTVVLALVGCLVAVGALIAARGHAVLVGVLVGVLIVVLGYAALANRRRGDG
jgi:Flp pilus assembly protein TadB